MPFGGQAPQHLGHGLGLGLVQPRRHLVEEQEAGLVGQGAAQLDQAGPAGREAVDPVLGDVGQAEPFDELVGHLVRVRLLDVALGRPGGPGAADLGPGEDVLPHGQEREDLEALERAGQAPPGPLVGGQAA